MKGLQMDLNRTSAKAEVVVTKEKVRGHLPTSMGLCPQIWSVTSEDFEEDCRALLDNPQAQNPFL